MIAKMAMELIEKSREFESRFSRWSGNENLATYPFVENLDAPFSPLKRSLPLTNLALISSAGAYIDGTNPFDTISHDGDLSFREIPIEVEAEDLRYAARGYDAADALHRSAGIVWAVVPLEQSQLLEIHLPAGRS